MKRLAILLCLFCIGPLSAEASHIMGGQIDYRWLGGLDYEVRLSVMYDCWNYQGPAGGDFVTIQSSCGNLGMNLQHVVEVEVATCSGFLSQCQGGLYPGAMLVVNIDTISLPTGCADWVFEWASCCRNSGIANILDPDLSDIVLRAELDNFNHPGNSSTVLQELPGVLVCNNAPFCFPNGGYDADGDSLVYSQVVPAGAVGGGTVTFLPGFTASAPLPSANGHVFDPVTGNHCFTPNVNGQYIMAYRVDEYRNGVWVGSSQREMQLWVLNCPAGLMDIAGTVYDTTATPVNSGEVQLFQYGLNMFGSVQVNSATLGVGGSYSFPNLPMGQYLVRCISDTANYPGTADSYHTSTYYWTYADVVATQCDTAAVVDINLVPTGNLNGPGVLSGFLGDLGIVRSQLGAPWPGVAVLLESWPSTGLVAFTRTDNDGLWAMSGIPNGTYRVVADHPGLPMRGHYIITIGGGQTTYNDLDYTADPQGFWPSAMLMGGAEPPSRTELAVHPNPTDGAQVHVDGLMLGSYQYELIGSDGRTLSTFPLAGPSDVVDVRAVPPGMYTLRCTTGRLCARLLVH